MDKLRGKVRFSLHECPWGMHFHNLFYNSLSAPIILAWYSAVTPNTVYNSVLPDHRISLTVVLYDVWSEYARVEPVQAPVFLWDQYVIVRRDWSFSSWETFCGFYNEQEWHLRRVRQILSRFLRVQYSSTRQPWWILLIQAWLLSFPSLNRSAQRIPFNVVQFKMAATRTRNLEHLLKFKPKSREKRKRLYKNLITALVQYERIETTINRCHDLSRVAERVSWL